VSERPRWIDRDKNGKLHAETRNAIEWPDGWGLHVIHGQRQPGVLDSARPCCIKHTECWPVTEEEWAEHGANWPHQGESCLLGADSRGRNVA